ncbi:CsbD family protein [Nitrococcus mobilis]|uniref:CsbD-like protein n=1 Tax=Nitrococcus mobilis Nb-231 TaxID=314278 RepID=A4BVD5_9GAMM|nr:CsbD family protein [Nitrococcus mobilis]EAR20320.1 CsbD-like protein [Nitrococcus mobilis Nb-231]
MNWDQIKGNWKQFKGKAQVQWGKLTNDELDQVDGHREVLVGKIQEKYGISKEEADRQVSDFENKA